MQFKFWTRGLLWQTRKAQSKHNELQLDLDREHHGVRGDKVARETQYLADPFVAPAFRAQWVKRMDI
jgi:hypothetical protein